LISRTRTAMIAITPPQCGQRIGGLGFGCQGSGRWRPSEWFTQEVL
jgi:hypothetical protein